MKCETHPKCGLDCKVTQIRWGNLTGEYIPTPKYNKDSCPKSIKQNVV